MHASPDSRNSNVLDVSTFICPLVILATSLPDMTSTLVIFPVSLFEQEEACSRCRLTISVAEIGDAAKAGFKLITIKVM